MSSAIVAARPDGGTDHGPPALTPQDAVDRYLDHRQTDARASSIKSWKYDLKLFVEWCEEKDIERVQDLTGWLLDEYETHRRGEGVAPSTINSEMQTLKTFLEYCERLDLVDEGLPERVEIPQIPEGEESSDKQLVADRARDIIHALRNSPEHRATRKHAVLEVLWWTGCRLGGLRALDVSDYDAEERYVMFRDRPGEETPLKNGRDGERAVGLPTAVTEVLSEYLEDGRNDVADAFGRRPLITTTHGRITANTIRTDCYLATQPCLHTDCPHGRVRETCEYTARAHASKCPSVRAPHHIRTGSISWQRDCGVPAEIVAARVNATMETIEKYYDKTSERERMERRRRPFLDELGFDQEDDST